MDDRALYQQILGVQDPWRVDRKHPAGGVRTDVLSHSTNPSHGGWTHVTEPPGNPGRFRQCLASIPSTDNS
jgi:hypothetical protein